MRRSGFMTPRRAVPPAIRTVCLAGWAGTSLRGHARASPSGRGSCFISGTSRTSVRTGRLCARRSASRWPSFTTRLSSPARRSPSRVRPSSTPRGQTSQGTRTASTKPIGITPFTWRARRAANNLDTRAGAGQLTCPAGVIMPFEPGRTVRFPKDTCAACPLRARCTTSSHGRSVSIHPDETLLAELRRRQHTPDGRAKLRERVAVEHALAHVGHWQGRRARYRGTRKNLFDLRRVAVVHNLHVIARQPATGDYQLAA